MAPIGNKRQRKTDAAGSSSRPEPVESHAPWPRLEGTRIKIRRDLGGVPAEILVREDVVNRAFTETWDDYDSLLYNEWLKVKLAPTRVANPRTMSGLGIKDGVLRLLSNAGLGTIATRSHSLYPDLVRQFFASVRFGCVDDSDGGMDDMRRWRLSFKIRGVCHMITLRDLCRVYGFDEDRAYQELPESIPDVQDFWARFGTGRYAAASSTHTDVRHPVLRYLLRLFSSTILYKVEPGKMRLQELVMLSYALRMDIDDTPWSESQAIGWMEPHPNMGAVLARHWLSLKNTPLTLKKSSKPFAAGSLLTPLFAFCRIDTSECTVDSSWCTVDIDYLTRATWLKSDVYWVFRPTPGQPRMVRLPIPALMDIAANPLLLDFHPDERLLQAIGAGRKQVTRHAATASSSGAGPSRPTPQFPQFPARPPIPMEQSEFQSWVAQSLESLWDAISTLSRCGCVRPRSSSPRRQPSSSPVSEEED